VAQKVSAVTDRKPQKSPIARYGAQGGGKRPLKQVLVRSLNHHGPPGKPRRGGHSPPRFQPYRLHAFTLPATRRRGPS